MTKRYLGNIITQNPTAPTDNYETTSAAGVWSLAEAFAYNKAGLWPTAGNLPPQTAIFAGGSAATTNIQTIDIATTGNSSGFGSLPDGTASDTAAVGSSTRSVIAGGLGSGITNLINYVTFASAGDSLDFGDLTAPNVAMVGSSNATRGLFSGGESANGTQYITIASLGNAQTFGDLYANGVYRLSACASPTRALVGVGYPSGAASAEVVYYTIASTGSSTSFGNISSSRRSAAAFSSSTRGVFGGGEFGNGSAQNVIDYFTIASTGNASDFGDLTVARAYLSSAAGTTRGVFCGGEGTDVMDFVTISSTGNATDFGDFAYYNNQIFGGASNSHGGLA